MNRDPSSGFYVLDYIDKGLLGIEHDQPFAASQLPYLRTLARAALDRADEQGPFFRERVDAIIDFDPDAIETEGLE